MSKNPHTESELAIKIYTPDPAIRKPLSFLKDLAKDLNLSFTLGYSLFIKDIKGKVSLSYPLDCPG
ncbi:MAG: hypothetical protein IPI60_19795 [Saprospiraceae bacterium]|nr:hypothetical protein [Saprospiraceae bacterium]